MSRLFFRSWIIAALCAGLNCAPHDPAAKSGDSNPDATPKQITTPPKPVEVSNIPRERIDAALDNVRNRELLPEHGFWTFFHAILGVGPDHATFFNTKTGKRMKALDYICEGGEVRGMIFERVGPGRVDVISQPGSGLAQGHQDQFIAEMAQWNMPRDRKFIVAGKECTFEAFIRHSRDRASVSTKAGQELSWAIIIVSQYYGTDHAWTNDLGEKLTLEDVVRYEINQPIADSPACGGTHRLFGLSWAYHLHMAKGGKRDGIWLEVEKVSREYIERAKKWQNKDGSFSTDYLKGPGNVRNLQRRIHSSGHIFEWLSLALSDEEIRQPWMQDAADSLVQMILENRDQGLESGALYHAAHGLEMYRTRLYGPSQPNPPLMPPPPR